MVSCRFVDDIAALAAVRFRAFLSSEWRRPIRRPVTIADAAAITRKASISAAGFDRPNEALPVGPLGDLAGYESAHAHAMIHLR